MDTLTSNVLDSYLKAAETNLVSANTLRQMMGPEQARKSFEQRIEDAKSPVEIAQIVKEELASTDSTQLVGDDPTFEWDKFAPDYARKRTHSLPREDQLMEGSGEPFTPPVSTEDVAGL